jgi:prepilin-type N-terminal cleavage/methylation domain-containing protein/prepilin-type processing-associated H-X9-DG protein
MNIERLKRWHWLVTGSLLGLLLGYVWSSSGLGRDPVMRRPMTAAQLVEHVSKSRWMHQATLHDLTVYPASGGRQMITGQTDSDDGRTPFVTYVTLPFHPDAASPEMDVREFLGLATDKPINFPWWKATWFGPALGLVMGLALLGGFWPIAMRSLVIAGWGRKKKAEETKEPEPARVEQLPDPALSPESIHVKELDDEVDASIHAAPSAAPATNTPGIKELDTAPLQPLAPPPDEGPKEFGGEFYPVARPAPHKDKNAFSLIELMVAIGIIAVLMGIIFPALHRAQEYASVLRCANNVRQLGIGMQMYANDYDGVYFWRGADININGMDWYVYGGRETGNLNLGQLNLFNRITPRPLNKYLADTIQIFRCPDDLDAPWTHNPSFTQYPAPNEFEWVGNSYCFNANGYPLRPTPQGIGGLDGVKLASVSASSQTIVFFETNLFFGFDWHYSHEGNIGFADGHVEFLPMPDQVGELHWDP